MEASGAGLAAGGDAAQGDGGGSEQAQGGEAQGQAPDQSAVIAQLAEALPGLQDTQEQMRQFLSQQGEQAQEAEPPAPEAPQQPDLSFLEDPNVSLETAQSRLNEVIQDTARQMMAEQLAPLQEQVSNIDIERHAEALMQEFPDLRDDATAKSVMDAAETYAKNMGNPELVANPQFVRVIYLAGRAAQHAQEQGAQGAPDVATLEGAGGASPAGQQGAQPTADDITASWGKGGADVYSRL
jgi:hypothetical protein